MLRNQVIFWYLSTDLTGQTRLRSKDGKLVVYVPLKAKHLAGCISFVCPFGCGAHLTFRSNGNIKSHFLKKHSDAVEFFSRSRANGRAELMTGTDKHSYVFGKDRECFARVDGSWNHESYVPETEDQAAEPLPWDNTIFEFTPDVPGQNLQMDDSMVMDPNSEAFDVGDLTMPVSSPPPRTSIYVVPDQTVPRTPSTSARPPPPMVTTNDHSNISPNEMLLFRCMLAGPPPSRRLRSLSTGKLIVLMSSNSKALERINVFCPACRAQNQPPKLLSYRHTAVDHFEVEHKDLFEVFKRGRGANSSVTGTDGRTYNSMDGFWRRDGMWDETQFRLETDEEANVPLPWKNWHTTNERLDRPKIPRENNNSPSTVGGSNSMIKAYEDDVLGNHHSSLNSSQSRIHPELGQLGHSLGHGHGRRSDMDSVIDPAFSMEGEEDIAVPQHIDVDGDEGSGEDVVVHVGSRSLDVKNGTGDGELSSGDVQMALDNIHAFPYDDSNIDPSMSMNLSDAYPSTSAHPVPSTPHTSSGHIRHPLSQMHESPSSLAVVPGGEVHIFFCAYTSDSTGQRLMRHIKSRKRLLYIGGTVPENTVLRLTCPIHKCSKATWERIPLLRHHFRNKHHDLFDVFQETRHPPQLGLKDRDNNVYDFRVSECFWKVKHGGKEEEYEIETEEEALEPLVWAGWTSEDMKGRDRIPELSKRKRSLIPGVQGVGGEDLPNKRKKFSGSEDLEMELEQMRQRIHELEQDKSRLEDAVRLRDDRIRELGGGDFEVGVVQDGYDDSQHHVGMDGDDLGHTHHAIAPMEEDVSV